MLSIMLLSHFCSGVDGGLVERCIAHSNGGTNGHLGGGPFAIWAWNANAVRIAHCVAYNNFNGHPAGNSNDGGGFDLDGGTSNCVVEFW